MALKNILLAGLITATAMSGADLQTNDLTVKQAQKFRNTLRYTSDKEQYGVEDHLASYKEIVEHKMRDDCDGFALAVAARVKDKAPLILTMQRRVLPLDHLIWQNPSAFGPNTNIQRFGANEAQIGHAVFAYQENGKWGCIGIDSAEDRKAKYESVEALVKSLKSPFDAIGWESYQLNNLTELYGTNWINGDGNLLAQKNPNAVPIAQGRMPSRR